MSERIWKSVAAWKAVCLALAAVLVVQVARAVHESGPEAAGGGMAAALVPEPGREANGRHGETRESTPSGTANTVPVAYRPIVDRRLFGVKPTPPERPIVLEGIAHDVVFLCTPRGRSVMIRAGETLDGITLLEIAQNRVLVEYKGARRELTIHQGLGSRSLLPRPAPPSKPKSEPTTPQNRASVPPSGRPESPPEEKAK